MPNLTTQPTALLGHHIEIKQLTGVGDVELDFIPNKQVYCLIGENGIGKTKCLEALFRAYFATNDIFYSWYASKNHRFTSIDGYEDIYKRIFTFNDTEIHLYPDPHKVKRECGAISFSEHDMPIVYIDTFRATNFNNNLVRRKRIAERSFRHKDYTDALNETVYKNDDSYIQITDKYNIHEWIIQRANSANPYQAKDDNRQIEIVTLLKILHSLDERINSQFLEITSEDKVYIKVNKEQTELSELSSGFASLLKVIQSIIESYSSFTNETDISQIAGVVFIDEIESHLHTKWQAHIISKLKQLFPNTTFYITTHSPIVISQLENGEAYELYRDESDHKVKTRVIDNPNSSAFIDLLKDAFDIDINRLKLDRDNAPNQKNAKKLLSDLLSKRISELQESEES